MHKHHKSHTHMKGVSEEMHEMAKHTHHVGHEVVSHKKAASGHAHLKSGHPKMPKNHSGK